MSSAKRRKKWKDEDMEKALEIVQKSQATLSGAAKQFDVPRKTLDDRVKGHGICMGISKTIGQSRPL